MRFCINCKYFSPMAEFFGTLTGPHCAHEKGLNPIWGTPRPVERVRNDERLCGRTGYWFEPKESAPGTQQGEPL